MSDWLIHFVHDRNTENEAPPWDMQDGTQSHYPVAFHGDEAPIFTYWPEQDDYHFPHDAKAAYIMEKILGDGHIRSGWSFRGGKPTIYGPRSAVCFTEMPLYALLAYAKSRSDEQNVRTYGIALPKAEMFQAGARPVIYGLSGMHMELPCHPSSHWSGPRLLAEKCGIAPHEQYRYVTMILGGDRRIDWSHEREWRWTKEFIDIEAFPGLPIWSEGSHSFSRIVLIVQSEAEAKHLLDRLKSYHDLPFNHDDCALSRNAIERTRVLALEMVADHFHPDSSTRLEDLPVLSLQKFVKPKPSSNLLEKVQMAVAKARSAAREADDLSDTGGQFGFASVVTYDAQSEITQALLDLDYVKQYEPGTYVVGEVMKDVRSLMIDIVESAAEAAAKVLNSELDQKFWMHSRLD